MCIKVEEVFFINITIWPAGCQGLITVVTSVFEQICLWILLLTHLPGDYLPFFKDSFFAVADGCSSWQEQSNSRYAKERIQLNLLGWNLRTLLDLKVFDKCERRTALVTKELQRINTDIVALSAIRPSDKTENGIYYLLLGKSMGEKREGH